MSDTKKTIKAQISILYNNVGNRGSSGNEGVKCVYQQYAVRSILKMLLWKKGRER